MQWLTAILAFLTTMLVFSIVVTTLVETFHRFIGSRARGFERMLERYYDLVLKPRLDTNITQLTQSKWVSYMISAPTSAPELQTGQEDETTKPVFWSFKRLSWLPTITFMERLGTSHFSIVVDTADKGTDREYLLKDLALKYETIGEDISKEFEHWARLRSVIVAMVVAWIFYVHPHNLIQTFLEEPQIAERIALLADETTDSYTELLKAAEVLQTGQTAVQNQVVPLAPDKVDELVKQITTDIENARINVARLSESGAPIGWPEDDVRSIEIWGISIFYPTNPKDMFWLLMGGLLIGLGAPHWAKAISLLTQAQNVSKSIAEILSPQKQTQPTSRAPVLAVDETPDTTKAFYAARVASPTTSSS